MDIQEIRNKKNILENSIRVMVDLFEAETLTQVDEVDVWHSYDLELEKDVALVGVRVHL